MNQFYFYKKNNKNIYFVKFYRILIILVTDNNLNREREKLFALLSSEKKKCF